MKKLSIVIIISLLCVVIGVFLIGCSANENVKAKSEDILEYVSSKDGRYGSVHYEIYRDKETGQEYIVVMNYSGGISITPRLSKDVKEK